jgi:hypothetical protein
MNRRFSFLSGLLVVALTWWWGTGVAETATAPSPCAGNVCAGTIVVGGQAVAYAYTQHVAPGGQLRIRLNGGLYNTTGLVSYIVSGLPTFSSWNKLANPVGGAIYLPEEDVNPGRTAYERRSSGGVTGQVVDQVMSVGYAALASGAYSFDLLVIQHGETGGLTGLTFYVDAAAPTNADESAVWAFIPGMDLPCSDATDNDLDFLADCADPQCAGQVGDAGSGAMCEQPELTCNDSFDNDGDGAPDCADASCAGRVGQPSGAALCQYGNEFGAGTCGDIFDNDADGLADCLDNQANDGLPAHACWKQSGYGCPSVEDCVTGTDDDKDRSFDSVYDAQPLTGVNCQDYDCVGDAACPTEENRTVAGDLADERCFDTLDNDLDHATDCADPNCSGVFNPANPAQQCYDKEFDLGARFQFCADAFDDDGDAAADCADSDCMRRFGDCGPCPSREDVVFSACADGRDQDTDAAADCADADCAGRLGRLAGAAFCAAIEDTDDLCGDGFDNDRDGTVDCADADCAGRRGPLGQLCEVVGETSCGDGLDNDSDGLIDCADPNCIGVSACAAQSYAPAACQVIPSQLGPLTFTGNDPTVLFAATAKNHAGSADVIRLTGSAAYSSVTVIVGDNTDPAANYPYAAPAPGCQLLDTATMAPSVRFAFTVVPGHALQIYNTIGPDIGGFDITLSCVTPAAPAARRDYPVSLSALKQPGARPEYGDVGAYTTLYEATPPVVSEVEAEGDIGGTISVPFGAVASPEGRRFRAVADDPGGAPPLSSGICHCDVELTGTGYTATYAAGADCVTLPLAFEKDDGISARGRAEDGAANLGDWSAAWPFTVNVTPAVSRDLAVTPASPFFRDGAMAVGLDAEFRTGTSDTFPGTCAVYLRTSGGAIIGGPVGPTFTFPGATFGNVLSCFGAPALPSVADGTYFVTVRGTDGDGDWAETARRVAYVCNSVPGPGDPDPGNGCAWADFDADGAAEGFYTSLYSTAAKACDNCIGLPNASQTDANANGVGDVCEPTKIYGRCEIDREIVCECDSDEVCGLPCPGPSIGTDGDGNHVDPQHCREIWGLCTLGGEICFDDPECPGGPGLCGGDATACYRDIDCVNAGVDGPCIGADRCENLLYPWLQTVYGNVFSKRRITAPDVPPQNQYNATYCIIAKDAILNFRSELCSASVDATAHYDFPKRGNLYATVLGRIDVDGLRAGRFGDVVDVPGGDLAAAIASYAGHLGGRVFRVSGDAQLGASVIMNDATDGSGTILVDGGNLSIVGDVTYDPGTALTPRGLASLGIIVLDDGTSAKGNIYIDQGVSRIVGATYAGGDDGIWSVAPPATESNIQLTAYGFMLARQFHFSRSYKSLTEGSERIIYDGRAIANPPPGFGDIGKALPRYTE